VRAIERFLLSLSLWLSSTSLRAGSRLTASGAHPELVEGQALHGRLQVAFALLLAACAPAAPGGQNADRGASPDGNRSPGKALVMAARVEPQGLAFKLLISSADTRSARRLLNAPLMITDDKGVTRPSLIAALPTLGSDSWRVFPDGRMETTYQLRPNLTWHDGNPLTAEDFVFALRAVRDPEAAPLFFANPQSFIDEMLAPDLRTILIRWKEPFPEAGALLENDIIPLPRHILEQPFDRDRRDTFANHPYWNQEYVGTGPFKLDSWQQGAFMELSAFDGHALGRPKIDRVRFTWIADPNTALANLLAGDVHVATNNAVQFQQGAILEREWGARGGGSVLRSAREARFVQIQFRPEYQIQPAFFDLRVRKALAHSIDKQSLVDGLLDGQSIVADTLPSPQMDYYQALLNGIPRYPSDARQADQVMAEVGWAKAPEGFYTNVGGTRFLADFRAFAGGSEEREQAILVDGLRRGGWDLTSTVVPEISSRDVQMRATFPALTANVTQLAERTLLNKLQGYAIPMAENRWAGTNRGAWNSPEFDRVEALFNTTLDRGQRDQLMIQMMRLVNEDVGVIPLYYNPDTIAHVGALKGPTTSAPDTLREWNVYEWEWR